MLNLNLPADQIRNAHDPDTELCVSVEGVEHDFRPNTYMSYGQTHTSWVCVWCHGIACGDYGSFDPCMEIYHHSTPHKTRGGVTWRIGATRPDGVTA